MKTNLAEAIFIHICCGMKFKMGRTIYEYVGKTFDVADEEVTYVTSGKKAIEPCKFEIYIVKDSKGNYKALSEKIYGKKIVEIL